MPRKKKVYYRLTEKALNLLEGDGDRIEINTRVFDCGRNTLSSGGLLFCLLSHAKIFAPQHNGTCRLIPNKFCEEHNITQYEFVKDMEKLHKYGFVRIIGKDQEAGEYEIYIEQDNPIKQYGKLRTRAERRKHYLKWD